MATFPDSDRRARSRRIDPDPHHYGTLGPAWPAFLTRRWRWLDWLTGRKPDPLDVFASYEGRDR